MTGIADGHLASHEGPPRSGALTPNAEDDVKMLGYWISLGAAAGGLGGGLMGGVGGRLAMFVLRLTSDDSVRGRESDDGFTIGRFSFLDSLNLLALCMVMGAIIGLIVVAGRPFFPKRGMPFAWAIAGAITGGAMLVHEDGVDFRVLEPHWLAVSLFIIVPAAGSFLIAWLTGVYPRFWWRNRKATIIASVAAIPAVIFFPLGIVTAIVAGLWLLSLRIEGARELARFRPARVAAAVVFGIIVVLGLADLTSDAQAII